MSRSPAGAEPQDRGPGPQFTNGTVGRPSQVSFVNWHRATHGNPGVTDLDGGGD
jgi:hypothetical protein